MKNKSQLNFEVAVKILENPIWLCCCSGFAGNQSILWKEKSLNVLTATQEIQAEEMN